MRAFVNIDDTRLYAHSARSLADAFVLIHWERFRVTIRLFFWKLNGRIAQMRSIGRWMESGRFQNCTHENNLHRGRKLLLPVQSELSTFCALCDNAIWRCPIELGYDQSRLDKSTSRRNHNNFEGDSNASQDTL